MCKRIQLKEQLDQHFYQNQVNRFDLPNQLAKAKYCNLWAWAGISLAISWWIIGKKGGQFLSSVVTPAGMQHMKVKLAQQAESKK